MGGNDIELYIKPLIFTLMKKVKIFYFILFFFTSCDNDHGNYSFKYNGITYEIVKDRKSWADATKYAVEHGAKLAEIRSVGEQNAIYYALTHDAGVSPEYTHVKDGGDIAYVWIGATDKKQEGTWTWTTTNSGNGDHFWNGQGYNGKGDGAAFNNAFINWGGTWNYKCMEPDNYMGSQNAGAVALSDWPKDKGTLGHAGEWNDINESNHLYFVIQYGNK